MYVCITIVTAEPRRSDSNCGELNAVASEWMDAVDSELRQYLAAASLAEFDYETNLTQHNQRQVRACRNP